MITKNILTSKNFLETLVSLKLISRGEKLRLEAVLVLQEFL